MRTTGTNSRRLLISKSTKSWVIARRRWSINLRKKARIKYGRKKSKNQMFWNKCSIVQFRAHKRVLYRKIAQSNKWTQPQWKMQIKRLWIIGWTSGYDSNKLKLFVGRKSSSDSSNDRAFFFTSRVKLDSNIEHFRHRANCATWIGCQ